MQNLLKSTALLTMFAIVLGGTESAGALTLVPGLNTPLGGTTAFAQPFLKGTVLEDVMTPFTLSYSGKSVSGQIQSRVVRETQTGTLDFYWRVTTDAPSTGAVSFFRIGNFHANPLDANYRTDGLGTVAPTSAFLFTNPTPGYVNFLFSGDALGNGASSNFLLLHTGATRYAASAIMDVASSGTFAASGTMATFSAVPEPQTWAMMLLGFAGLGLAGLRRRKGAAVEA